MQPIHHIFLHVDSLYYHMNLEVVKDGLLQITIKGLHSINQEVINVLRLIISKKHPLMQQVCFLFYKGL